MRIPECVLKISIESLTPDENGDQTLRQRVVVEEYSESPQEHIYKNVKIANSVMDAFGNFAESAIDGSLPWVKK
jgi:hypothetical protein